METDVASLFASVSSSALLSRLRSSSGFLLCMMKEL